MQKLPPKTLTMLRSSLNKCVEFSDHSRLQAMFKVDNRISAWYDQLPDASSVGERVERTIALLVDRWSTIGENGLVLLLRALIDRYPPEDALHEKLLQRVDDIERAFGTLRLFDGRERQLDISEIVQQYIAPQQRALEEWRLFGFQRDIKITEIYVREILHAPQGGLLRGSSITPPIHESKIFGWLHDDVQLADQVYIITGRAGSGKSTMLRKWTLELLDEHQIRSASRPPPIPIYLSLRNLILPANGGQPDASAAPDLAQCLARTIYTIEEESAQLPFRRVTTLSREESNFTRMLGAVRAPEWIFFCDGLDEAPLYLREQLFHWMQKLPGAVRVVLTTRRDILEQINIPRSKLYEICDFNDEQVETFVAKWFRERQTLGDAFLQQIRLVPALQSLTTIPLLLTFLSLDVELRNQPPPADLSESALLLKIVRILLDEWDALRDRRAANWDFIRLGLSLFTNLALQASKDGRYNPNFTYETLYQHASAYAPRIGVSPGAVQEFLQRLTRSEQLLIKVTDDEYTFSHAIFFDFFFSQATRALIKQAAQTP